MKTINRLVKISCYYSRIKELEFYRDYDNKRIIDARSIVYHICLNTLNYTIYEIAEIFNKPETYILEILSHHKSEYNIIKTLKFN
jgi:chromosomal replication initiation ATPase DnaA